MNVLSLCNGVSCGYMALEVAGIKITNYYSSEIDKYANQATEALFPDVVQLGDLKSWKSWDIDWASIDLVIAGFPCQTWSLLGTQKGKDDPRGDLVHTLIDIWTHVNASRRFQNKPRVKFMWENVKMAPANLSYINELFGIEPVQINSSLVSAQNRNRYYWTNIPNVTQPEDRMVTFESVVEPSDKKFLPATVRKGDPRPIKLTGQKFLCLTATYFKGIRADGRPALSTQAGVFDELREQGECRQLTPRECLRLQTVPEHHIDTLLSAGISNTQLYKLAGNGWTVEVIAHIFSKLNNVAAITDA